MPSILIADDIKDVVPIIKEYPHSFCDNYQESLTFLHVSSELMRYFIRLQKLWRVFSQHVLNIKKSISHNRMEFKTDKLLFVFSSVFWLLLTFSALKRTELQL